MPLKYCEECKKGFHSKSEAKKYCKPECKETAFKRFREELVEVKRLYNENFEKLRLNVEMEKHDTDYHRALCKIENKLNKREIELMKELDIYVQDPCPLMGANFCDKCTGYYKITHTGKKATKGIMVDPEKNPGAHYCKLHKVRADLLCT